MPRGPQVTQAPFSKRKFGVEKHVPGVQAAVYFCLAPVLKPHTS